MMENRTVRRFRNIPVNYSNLQKLVELTRYCASGRNAQQLRYRIVSADCEKTQVFPLLKWAGYFPDWDGPEPSERPEAYLIQCLDTDLGKDVLCDDGLQLEAITLGARTLGLGSCIIKSFNAPKLAEVLELPANMLPRYVLALGYPAETVKIEDMDGTASADFKYYRTEDGIHHVPKRPLSELLIH